MYRLILLLFLINCRLIRCQGRRTILNFQYYSDPPNKNIQLRLDANIMPKTSSTVAYILTGNLLNKNTLNVSLITCTLKLYSYDAVCLDKFQNFYIIVQQIFGDDNVLKIDKYQNLKNIIHGLILNTRRNATMNLTCTKEEISEKPNDPSQNLLSKTSLVSIIFLTSCLVLTVILCFGWFFLIYYRRFVQHQITKKIDKALLHSVQQMLDKSPIITFDSIKKINNDTDEDPVCAICIESFVVNDKLRKLGCSHYFHVACIDPWLLTHQTCPLCNQNILDDCIPSISACVTSNNDETNNRGLATVNNESQNVHL